MSVQRITVSRCITYNPAIRVGSTFTSAICFSFCQFQTDRMWSLASSTAQRKAPPFWQETDGLDSYSYLTASSTLDPPRDADLLTDLEKDTHVTALSNTPIPITWRVLRVTESQTRIWGGSGWTDSSRGWIRRSTLDKHTKVCIISETAGGWVVLHITFPSLEFPATWPVAMVTMSGCTQRLEGEKYYFKLFIFFNTSFVLFSKYLKCKH